MVRGRLRSRQTVVDDPGRVGNGRRMSPDEARAFVASNHRAVLITRRSGRGLQTSPVLVGVDDDGKVVISTWEGAYKTRNLRRDPRAVLCVLSDGFFGPWIRIEGTAQIVSLPEAMAGLVDYYRGISGEHPDWDDYRRAMQQEQRVLVRVSIDAAGPAHAR
jgi:PPOX class probable F420-dependent enzyme